MANPTTNYGFVLPTPTDLVTDLPADFDVALQGVDTRLKALQPGTTAGDLMYASSTANTNVRLGIGSTNQVLAVVGGVPAWTTPASGALTLVTRQSFSSVATTTTTFDGCFTSTYKNYMIVIENIESSTNNTLLHFQYRSSGPTTKAQEYYGSMVQTSHTGTVTTTLMANTAFVSVVLIGATANATNGNSGNLYVGGVGGSSAKPTITGLNTGNTGTGPSLLGVSNDGSAVYTGFILKAAAGNITGTVAVYGLGI